MLIWLPEEFQILKEKKNNMQKLTPEQIALFCEFCDVSADYILGIKANNKMVYDQYTIEDIMRKMKDIEAMLNQK